MTEQERVADLCERLESGWDNGRIMSEASAELKRLAARCDALEGALREIAGRHIPDQPAAYGGDELDWAVRQHGALRQIARAALKEPSHED